MHCTYVPKGDFQDSNRLGLRSLNVAGNPFITAVRFSHRASLYNCGSVISMPMTKSQDIMLPSHVEEFAAQICTHFVFTFEDAHRGYTGLGRS